MNLAELPTVALRCQHFGESGPPLMILHGLFGAGRNWYSLARKLADECQLHVPDLRGHGESPQVGPIDYPHMAADVLALMDREGLASASLLGHSMGGKVAMTLALHHPERVEKLIVVDIAPVQYSHNFDHVIAALRALPLERIHSRREAEAWLNQHLDNPLVCQFLLQNLVADDHRYRWRIDLDLIAEALPGIVGFPLDDQVRPFEGPTLFIAGGRSEYLKPQYHQAIRTLFPNARIQTIANAGHWVHSDEPEVFLDVVRCFLREA
ncbi:esterase [Methylomarinovum caldicuralii]|uniref:Esterase n=1 Tax=Methylomarinovum caldicuralii TaxID=438856 RepID=A0AAU9CPH3_9GAMM|nr:alpha/beta fold hydrolase [Methylomarinovum caldicuralii]BCX81417.1 esterase [Methylomarinovum caldicuralii]